MIVRFVLVRTALSREDRRRFQQIFYDNGWPRDTTMFVFDPQEPASGDAHLEYLKRCRDAGEYAVAILEPEPLPIKAMRAGFPHLVMNRVAAFNRPSAAMRVVAVQPKLEVFVPDPPPAA